MNQTLLKMKYLIFQISILFLPVMALAQTPEFSFSITDQIMAVFPADSEEDEAQVLITDEGKINIIAKDGCLVIVMDGDAEPIAFFCELETLNVDGDNLVLRSKHRVVIVNGKEKWATIDYGRGIIYYIGIKHLESCGDPKESGTGSVSRLKRS